MAFKLDRLLSPETFEALRAKFPDIAQLFVADLEIPEVVLRQKRVAITVENPVIREQPIVFRTLIGSASVNLSTTSAAIAWNIDEGYAGTCFHHLEYTHSTVGETEHNGWFLAGQTCVFGGWRRIVCRVLAIERVDPVDLA